jgi:Uma2 family endonuclease
MASVIAPPVGQRLLLHGIDWRTYRRLGRIFTGHRAVRLTYDRGTLEIRTTSPEHESYRRLLARFVDVLTEELNMPMVGYGSMTFRMPRRRGLEPDECYWFTQAGPMRGRGEIDFRRDPPPDLVLEVDITSSSVDRMAIYASLGVVEVWRFDGVALTFHVLQPDRTLQEQPASRAFPGVTSPDLFGFLMQRGQRDETDLIRSFRAWVRQQPGGASAGGP